MSMHLCCVFYETSPQIRLDGSQGLEYAKIPEFLYRNIGILDFGTFQNQHPGITESEFWKYGIFLNPESTITGFYDFGLSHNSRIPICLYTNSGVLDLWNIA
jgi:hypothetical protein